MKWDRVASVILVIAWVAQIGYIAFDELAILLGGAIAATLYFCIQFGRTSRPGQIFLLIMPVLAFVTWIYSADPYAELADAAASGLLMVTFVGALSTLRVAAASSDLMRRCGAHLLSQKPSHSYSALNLGSMMAATVLLFGVMGLFGAMIAQSGAAARSMRRAMLAVLRGYAMMPIWSPIALPFGLLSVHYSDAEWLSILPFGLASLVVIFGVGLIADKIEYGDIGDPPAATDRATASRDLTQLALLVLGIMGLVAGFSVAFQISTVTAAMIMIPVVAIVWRVLQSSGSTETVRNAFADGLVGERSILAVMAGAGVCGVLLGELIPVDGLTALLASAQLPPVVMPALIIAVFMGLGQVGFSPTLTFIMLAIVIPDSSVLGIPPVIYHATILSVWGLASIGTPFSVPAMVASRLFGDSPSQVVYRWSPVFLVGAPVAAALMLGVLVFAV